MPRTGLGTWAPGQLVRGWVLLSIWYLHRQAAYHLPEQLIYPWTTLLQIIKITLDLSWYGFGGICISLLNHRMNIISLYICSAHRQCTQTLFSWNPKPCRQNWARGMPYSPRPWGEPFRLVSERVKVWPILLLLLWSVLSTVARTESVHNK